MEPESVRAASGSYTPVHGPFPEAVVMPDESGRMREQVMCRLQEWGDRGVPTWKFGLLVARTFQAVVAEIDPDIFSSGDGTDQVIRWLLEAASRGAGGGNLTSDEIRQATTWVGRATAGLRDRCRGRVRTWASENLGVWVHCLRNALSDPEAAAGQMVGRMSQPDAGAAGDEARWLRAMLKSAVCLRPDRLAVIDPRWRT